jgi:hypothetical protein
LNQATTYEPITAGVSCFGRVAFQSPPAPLGIAAGGDE